MAHRMGHLETKTPPKPRFDGAEMAPGAGLEPGLVPWTCWARQGHIRKMFGLAARLIRRIGTLSGGS
jgi:hypothetical protein